MILDLIGEVINVRGFETWAASAMESSDVCSDQNTNSDCGSVQNDIYRTISFELRDARYILLYLIVFRRQPC